MARKLAAILMALGVCLAACDSDDDDNEGCAMRTTGLSGEAPDCTNTLECGGNEWSLECDGANTGQCTCLKNGAVEKTIPYEDRFCPLDFSTADFDAHEAAAREACDWP